MNPHQRRAKKQEERIAEEVGGRAQPASGARWHSKGDVRAAGRLRVEAKHTSKPSYTLKLKDLLKIRQEAVSGGMESWAMQVEFLGQAGGSASYAVLGYELYCDMHALVVKKSPLAVEWATVGERISFHKDELKVFADRVTAVSTDWCLVVTFLRDDGTKQRYAIIPWDDFLHLHKEFKP